MKRTFTFLFLLFIIFTNLFSQSHQLKVTISGFNSDGIAYISLIKEGDDFSSDCKTCISKKVHIKNGKCVIKYTGIKTGSYAIMAFHDENKNGELDTNFIGIPKEGVGVSNNTKGIPSFKKSAFKIEKKKLIAIKIKYLFRN